MGDVILKPLTKIETPDGPLYATEIDGTIVHGQKPMTEEGAEAVRALFAAITRGFQKQPLT